MASASASASSSMPNVKLKSFKLSNLRVRHIDGVSLWLHPPKINGEIAKSMEPLTYVMQIRGPPSTAQPDGELLTESRPFLETLRPRWQIEGVFDRGKAPSGFGIDQNCVLRVVFTEVDCGISTSRAANSNRPPPPDPLEYIINLPNLSITQKSFLNVGAGTGSAQKWTAEEICLHIDLSGAGWTQLSFSGGGQVLTEDSADDFRYPSRANRKPEVLDVTGIVGSTARFAVRQRDITADRAKLSALVASTKDVRPDARFRRQQVVQKLREGDLEMSQLDVKLVALRKKVADLKAQQEDRSTRLSRCQRGFSSVKSRLEGTHPEVRALMADRKAIERAIEGRRMALVRELRRLFPIGIASTSAESSTRRALDADAVAVRTIRGFSLPPVHVLNRQDPRVEENIATALGMLGQAVVLLAKIFELPTNLLLTPYGSRSYIRQIGSENTFALYYKGLDRHKFEQGLQSLEAILREMLRSRGKTILSSHDLLDTCRPLFE